MVRQALNYTAHGHCVQEEVVGRNNGVVGLTGFSYKKICGLLFGPQKKGGVNGMVTWRGSNGIRNNVTFHV